jgi:DNA-binding NtrC family response regulator
MEPHIIDLSLISIKTIIICSNIFIFHKAISYRRKTASSKFKLLWGFVAFVMACEAFSHLTWIVGVVRRFLSTPLQNTLWISRLGWILNCFEFFILGLFIEQLLTYQFKFSWRHYVSLAICSCMTIAYSYTIFFQFDAITTTERTLEYLILQPIVEWFAFITVLIAFSIALKKTFYKPTLPLIVRSQMKPIIAWLLVPELILTAITTQTLPITAGIIEMYLGLFFCLGDIVIVGAFYFAAFKLLRTRFLNVTPHVKTSEKFNFIDDFKEIINRLGYATKLHELDYITKSFFYHAFGIKHDNARLFIRAATPASSISPDQEQELPANEYIPLVEQVFAQPRAHEILVSYTQKTKILIRDELEFDTFYQLNPASPETVTFLESLNADIFLPLFDQKTLIGYIIIKHKSRPDQLYTDVDRDEMLVYVNYLTKIIYLMRHRSLAQVVLEEKELREELAYKQKEIQHGKEAIRTMMRSHSTGRIGTIYYRNKLLICGNLAASELVGVEEGAVINNHYAPILRKLAIDAKKFSSDRRITMRDQYGNPLAFVASIQPEKSSSVIILAFYPDIADTFVIPFDTIKDLADWEYALYLETTRSGQLINQLVPSSTQAMINFKIDLLKASFSKQPILIELSDNDTHAIVQILHHISLRSTLHTIALTGPEKADEIALQLFGIDPLIADTNNVPECLLQKLNETGTIFIQNIEYLSRTTQELLASFISQGIFQPLHSERRMVSNVKLLCSSSIKLEAKVQDGAFSEALFKLLKKHSVSMPSLLTLPQNELSELITKLGEQAIKDKVVSPLIQLDEQDRRKISNAHPVSIQELKVRVHKAIVEKSAHRLYKPGATITRVSKPIDQSFLVNDPEIAELARLGKAALKDRKIMRILWNKFNNQEKIAKILNVNKSTVCRRCKQYSLFDTAKEKKEDFDG